jgi:hypothetical protein
MRRTPVAVPFPISLQLPARTSGWLLATMAWSVTAAAPSLAAPAPATCTSTLASATAVASVLRDNQHAMGAFPTRGALTLTYADAGQGLTGTQVNRLDLGSGHFAESYQAGVAAEAFGFDGRTPWKRDFSGAYTSQRGGDFPALARNAAYRNANLWWRDGYAGAAISYVGREAVAAGCADHLLVQPRGGKPFDAWFDAGTYLLSQLSEVHKSSRHTTRYADYRRDGPVMVAGTVVADDGTGSLTTLALRATAFAAEQAASTYAHPATVPADADILGGAASTTVPFQFLNNHIFVTAMVNGSGPYNFLVDSGGHTIFSPELVEELGLDAAGSATATGAGETASTSGFAQARDIAIGNLRFRDQVAFTAPLGSPSVDGIRLDGVVGVELFLRFAVRIDYGARTITFTAPRHFTAPKAATAVPFEFYDGMPMVAGKTDALPARLVVDSGAHGELLLAAPFSTTSGLRARYPGVSQVVGSGHGGKIMGTVARLSSVTLGDVDVQQPIAAFSDDKRGVMSDTNFDVNVGSGLLKRFIVTFDYAHQRLYFERLAPAPADAGRFDRSGLRISGMPNGYVVTDVADNSAADAAGLKAGDLITSVNGQAARPALLSDVREALRAAPPGNRVELTYDRDGVHHALSLELRDRL